MTRFESKSITVTKFYRNRIFSSVVKFQSSFVRFSKFQRCKHPSFFSCYNLKLIRTWENNSLASRLEWFNLFFTGSTLFPLSADHPRINNINVMHVIEVPRVKFVSACNQKHISNNRGMQLGITMAQPYSKNQTKQGPNLL